MKLINWSFWLSIIAIICSVITIILWIIAPCKMTATNLDCFIGVAVALLAILVTMLLGWQIYNALEIKEKMSAFETLGSELKQQAQEMNQKYYKMSHLQALTTAHQSASTNDYVDAYRWLVTALAYTLSLEEPINVELILSEMALYVELIPSDSPIDIDLIEEMDYDHNTISQSPLFGTIKTHYMGNYTIFKKKVKIQTNKI